MKNRKIVVQHRPNENINLYDINWLFGLCLCVFVCLCVYDRMWNQHTVLILASCECVVCSHFFYMGHRNIRTTHWTPYTDHRLATLKLNRVATTNNVFFDIFYFHLQDTAFWHYANPTPCKRPYIYYKSYDRMSERMRFTFLYSIEATILDDEQNSG